MSLSRSLDGRVKPGHDEERLRWRPLASTLRKNLTAKYRCTMRPLRQHLAARARAEGVSLNTLAVSLLAEGLGRRDKRIV
jgi:hypothetical protein